MSKMNPNAKPLFASRMLPRARSPRPRRSPPRASASSASQAGNKLDKHDASGPRPASRPRTTALCTWVCPTTPWPHGTSRSPQAICPRPTRTAAAEPAELNQGQEQSQRTQGRLGRQDAGHPGAPGRAAPRAAAPAGTRLHPSRRVVEKTATGGTNAYNAKATVKKPDGSR